MSESFDRPASTKTSAEPGSSHNLAEIFGESVLSSVSTPIVGFKQLLGYAPAIDASAQDASQADSAKAQVGSSQQEKAPTGLEKFASEAGSFVGNAALFIGTASLAGRLPMIGRVAPVISGATIGFLRPTESGQGMATRLSNGLIGAGTMSIIEYGPVALEAGGLTGASRSMTGVVLTNAAAGVLNVQGDSLINAGHFAALGDSITAAGSWAATGYAFKAVGSLANRARSNGAMEFAKPIQVPPSAEPGFYLAGGESKPEISATPSSATTPMDESVNVGRQTGYQRHFVEIPGLAPFTPAHPESTLQLPVNSPLAQMYADAKQGVGKVEVLASSDAGMQGRFGTTFAITDDGRLGTAHHVVENALDVTVFDATGKPHEAHVVAENRDRDLGILQLSRASSFSAFKALPLADASENGTDAKTFYAAFGHPNGWKELYASPGTAGDSPRPAINLRFDMHGKEGLSGAPIEGDGEVVAVFTQAARSSDMQVNGTPVVHLSNLLATTSAADATEAASSVPVLESSTYRADGHLATKNLETIFGANFLSHREPDFFHQKIKSLNVPDLGGKLALKMQFDPTANEVTVKPIALNGAKIADELKWPGTNVYVNSARLRMLLGDGDGQLTITTSNDPMQLMPKAFNFRDTIGYLAELKPVKH